MLFLINKQDRPPDLYLIVNKISACKCTLPFIENGVREKRYSYIFGTD